MKRKRPGGRPPLNPDRTPASDVHVYMSASLYDQTYAAARRERLTVTEWIRQAIRRQAGTAPRSDQ